MEDLVLSSDGTLQSVQNLVLHNLDDAALLKISRDSEAPDPVNMAF